MPGFRLDTLKARRVALGLSITRLAQLSNTSDLLIQQLENGGNCDPEERVRIGAALVTATAAVAITSSSIANPTVFTTAAHKFVTGDVVTIAGHADMVPELNGDQTVTVIDSTSFSVPVNVTTGGTGGTATLKTAIVGAAAL